MHRRQAASPPRHMKQVTNGGILVRVTLARELRFGIIGSRRSVKVSIGA